MKKNISCFIPRYKLLYKNIIIKKLINIFKYKSCMQVPKLLKIVINRGFAKNYIINKKCLYIYKKELDLISGQKSVLCYSKKDISNFKLRKNLPIGCKVTLRNNNMYNFLDKLINIILPRYKNFQGVNDIFDNKGNYNLGIKEQIIFPEININKIFNNLGMNISIVIKNKLVLESKKLLLLFGFPFKKI
ncbi:MAG: 50S ribosomal protein L5 [Candidatus Shikimatogenerans sp. Ttur]|uniref:Large ribosomal subunit protein uL5 n=1 Tax=Candidatus Shikimatogenerans sp. Ttur TaxID=3158569 RepID=A0AAU7ZXE7_9FLAO